jgi:hypothetical protein
MTKYNRLSIVVEPIEAQNNIDLPIVHGRANQAQNNIRLPIVIEPIEAQNNIELPIVVEPVEAKIITHLPTVAKSNTDISIGVEHNSVVLNISCYQLFFIVCNLNRCQWCHVNCWMKPNGCYSQNIIWIYYIACNRMGASGLTEMYSYILK